MSKVQNLNIKPSMAWLLVFVPALSYFVATRLQSSGFRWGRSSRLGEVVTSSLEFESQEACSALSEIFYTTNSCESLQSSLNLLYQGRGMRGIVASTWKHDSELGRGYLLVSQAHGYGRIWRWEVGGGPIAIGRSLHLEGSGCRSKYYHTCNEESQVGSGGIAIDFYRQDRYSEGALVVAEWGEGRIVRMEQSTGARTPLIIQVPNICSAGSSRLHQPRSLMYTPFGDLLVADSNPECQRAAIYRLSQAVHVEPLESLLESRHAHAWEQTKHSYPMQIFYHNRVQSIGGMAMDPSWLNMFVTIKSPDGRVLLVKMPIAQEDADDDDDNSANQGNDEKKSSDLGTEDTKYAPNSAQRESYKGIMDESAYIVMDMTETLGVAEPGPLAVSETGQIFTAIPQGIAILSSHTTGKTTQATLLGYLPTPQPPTSLTLAEDKFLYSFSDDSIYRIQLRVGPINVPTNLVIGKS